MLNMIKAIFIDRDGTINVDKGYVYKPEDFELIPGVIEALKKLTDRGILIYIVTNQSGIARGYYTEKQFDILTEHMLSVFERESIKIEKVLYCPHHVNGKIPKYTKSCLCRKPGTKLIEDVMAENKFNIDEVVLIGDKNSDIEAGGRLNMKTYLVKTGYGKDEEASTKANFVTENLKSAVEHILELV